MRGSRAGARRLLELRRALGHESCTGRVTDPCEGLAASWQLARSCGRRPQGSNSGAVPQLKPTSAFAPAERTRCRLQRPLCQRASCRWLQLLHPFRTAPWTPSPPPARPADARLRVDAAVRPAHQPAHAPLQAGAQVLRHAVEQQHPPVPVPHAGLQGGRAAVRRGTRLQPRAVRVWPRCQVLPVRHAVGPTVQPAVNLHATPLTPCVLPMMSALRCIPAPLHRPPAAHAGDSVWQLVARRAVARHAGPGHGHVRGRHVLPAGGGDAQGAGLSGRQQHPPARRG